MNLLLANVGGYTWNFRRKINGVKYAPRLEAICYIVDQEKENHLLVTDELIRVQCKILKAIRTKLGFSVEEFYILTGISDIERIEAGFIVQGDERVISSFYYTADLCTMFGMSLDALHKALIKKDPELAFKGWRVPAWVKQLPSAEEAVAAQ